MKGETIEFLDRFMLVQIVEVKAASRMAASIAIPPLLLEDIIIYLPLNQLWELLSKRLSRGSDPSSPFFLGCPGSSAMSDDRIRGPALLVSRCRSDVMTRCPSWVLCVEYVVDQKVGSPGQPYSFEDLTR